MYKLAVNVSGTWFEQGDNGNLLIVISNKKLKELEKNRLLTKLQLRYYTGIILLKGNKELNVPILVNSASFTKKPCKVNGRKWIDRTVLTFQIAKDFKVSNLTQRDIDYWKIDQEGVI